jgi:shikimate kinase
MKGRAYCFGAATIINGIALGKGAAYGIGLKTTASVELNDEPSVFEVTIKGDESENPKLAEHCVLEVLNKFDLTNEHGAKISTRSEIPISRGLKSSSAAANAIVLATFNALGKEYSDLEIINLGVEASLKAKVTLTGAYDDACATYFGNVAVTDNLKREILAQYPIKEEYDVLIHVPDEKIKKSDVEVERLHGIKEALQIAHDLALNQQFLSAIQINGLAYGSAMSLDTEITTKALIAGAATAGITGTGPATVILTEPKRKEKILEAIGDPNRIICTTINRMKAGVE